MVLIWVNFTHYLIYCFVLERTWKQRATVQYFSTRHGFDLATMRQNDKATNGVFKSRYSEINYILYYYIL